MTKLTFIYFPSSDDARYDFYAVAPENMSKSDALFLADRAIIQANYEDNQNVNTGAGGGSNSGLCVQEYIIQELGKLGFTFVDEKPKLATTMSWDEYHGEPIKKSALNF